MGWCFKLDFKIISHGEQINLNISNNTGNTDNINNEDIVQAVTAKDKGYREEDLKEAVDKLNKFLKNENTYVEYSIHEKFGDVMIKIINKDTKEVIMECPPKKILDLVAKMMELVGVAVDKKA